MAAPATTYGVVAHRAAPVVMSHVVTRPDYCHVHEADKRRKVKSSRMVKRNFVTSKIELVPRTRTVTRTVMKAHPRTKYVDETVKKTITEKKIVNVPTQKTIKKTVMVDKEVAMDHLTYETRDKIVKDTVMTNVVRDVVRTRMEPRTVMTPHTTTQTRVTMERGVRTRP